MPEELTSPVTVLSVESRSRPNDDPNKVRTMLLIEYLSALEALNEILGTAIGALHDEKDIYRRLDHVKLVSRLVKEKVATLKAIESYDSASASRRPTPDTEKRRPQPMIPPPRNGEVAMIPAHVGMVGTFSGRRSD